MENSRAGSCRHQERFYRWGDPPDRRPRDPVEEWGYVVQSIEQRESCRDWSQQVKQHYDAERHIVRNSVESTPKLTEGAYLRLQAEKLRPWFTVLADQWRRETKFLSSLDDKVLNDAYQFIIAMGEAAVPLVLEELQAHRGHWFWALHFMTRVDLEPENATVDEARTAWLNWGREKGLLD
jgi:hypothetical protein